MPLNKSHTISLAQLEPFIAEPKMIYLSTLLSLILLCLSLSSATDPDGQITCIKTNDAHICNLRVTMYGGLWLPIPLVVYDPWCNHVGDASGWEAGKLENSNFTIYE